MVAYKPIYRNIDIIVDTRLFISTPHKHRRQRGRVVSVTDSQSEDTGFESHPAHVALLCPWERHFTLVSPVHSNTRLIGQSSTLEFVGLHERMLCVWAAHGLL